MLDNDPFAVERQPAKTVRHPDSKVTVFERAYRDARKLGIRLTRVMVGNGKFNHGSRHFLQQGWGGEVDLEVPGEPKARMSLEDAVRYLASR